MGASTTTSPAGVKPKGYPNTSEIDRMVALAGESQKIGEFLDWLMHEQNVRLMRWTVIEHEEECTAYKRAKHDKDSKQEALTGLAELEAEFRGVDPSTVVVPTINQAKHPDECQCKGTNIYRWTEEGWESARPERSGDVIPNWLAQFYGIDLDLVETQRTAVLAWVRKQNK